MKYKKGKCKSNPLTTCSATKSCYKHNYLKDQSCSGCCRDYYESPKTRDKMNTLQVCPLHNTKRIYKRLLAMTTETEIKIEVLPGDRYRKNKECAECELMGYEG